MINKNKLYKKVMYLYRYNNIVIFVHYWSYKIYFYTCFVYWMLYVLLTICVFFYYRSAMMDIHIGIAYPNQVNDVD